MEEDGGGGGLLEGGTSGGACGDDADAEDEGEEGAGPSAAPTQAASRALLLASPGTPFLSQQLGSQMGGGVAKSRGFKKVGSAPSAKQRAVRMALIREHWPELMAQFRKAQVRGKGGA